jgi:hypothetical protein
MNSASYTSFGLNFNPLVPEGVFYGLVAAGLLVLLLSLWRNRAVPVLRGLAFAAFVATLGNPVLTQEDRQGVRSVALAIVDESASQNFQDRRAVTAQALAALHTAYDGRPDIELRVVSAPAEGGRAARTDLFQALQSGFSDVPEAQRAGAVFLTDGQVHDAPAEGTAAGNFGPLHVILSGRRHEADRRISLIDAPAFGITGKSVTVRFRVDDQGSGGTESAQVSIKNPGAAPESVSVRVGEIQSVDLPIEHAGQNVFEFSTAPMDGEITAANNRAALEVQGVRDRMRVLLVSGRPHAGARTWRDLLKADPGVDLVHFTILRDPDKIDGTPTSEMSLIAFPFKELFEIKLYDFDLIIFDRYSLNNVLPEFYFDNIAAYVKKGGAFLEASGPEFAGKNSIYNTALKDVLPAAPTGETIEETFVPRVTSRGRSHPVTRGLERASGQDWGAWTRQVGATPTDDSDILMEGARGDPLLMLRRAGDGRAAQIASDQMWLWARGYEGGGPYAELLRRVVHWLMQEPELDERALEANAEGLLLTVRRPDYHEAPRSVAMTKPDGAQEVIELAPAADGMLEKRLTADQAGVYEFSTPDGQSRSVIAGQADPPEFRDVLGTSKKMEPASRASGGGMFWAADDGLPAMKVAGTGGRTAGEGWMALRHTGAYSVTGVRERPVLPLYAWAMILCGLLILCWWREGRT